MLARATSFATRNLTKGFNKVRHGNLLLSYVGAATLAVVGLHAATEVFVRLRSFFESAPALGLSSQNYKRTPFALCTGGVHGIGAAVVSELLRLGYQVEIWDRNNSLAEKNHIEAASEGKKKQLRFRQVDVSDAKQLEEACEDLLARTKHHGGPDLVFLGAGTHSRKSLFELTQQEVERTFNTNITVHMFVILRKLLPVMLKNSSDCNNEQGNSIREVCLRKNICLVSSVTGFSGFASASEYAASKAAVTSLGDAVRSEIRKFHSSSSVAEVENSANKKNRKQEIDCTVVCPYLTDTKLFSFCKSRVPFLLRIFGYSAMSAEYVASRIIYDGMRLRRSILVIPRLFYLMPILRNGLPEFCWIFFEYLTNANNWMSSN